jgi:hypothetical protein
MIAAPAANVAVDDDDAAATILDSFLFSKYGNMDRSRLECFKSLNNPLVFLCFA